MKSVEKAIAAFCLGSVRLVFQLEVRSGLSGPTTLVKRFARVKLVVADPLKLQFRLIGRSSTRPSALISLAKKTTFSGNFFLFLFLSSSSFHFHFLVLFLLPSLLAGRIFLRFTPWLG